MKDKFRHPLQYWMVNVENRMWEEEEARREEQDEDKEEKDPEPLHQGV